MILRTALLTSCLLAALSGQEVVKLPDHDSDRLGVQGSHARYVVAVPKDYDQSRKHPLLLDLHGAAPPGQEVAVALYKREWKPLADRLGIVIAAPNSRFRMWGRWGMEITRDYVLAVLAKVRADYNIDPARIYLSGFSSGSNFVCGRWIQAAAPIAGTMPVCAGPNVFEGFQKAQRANDPALEKTKNQPFFLAAGEHDMRKPATWELFVALDALGVPTMYRELPGKAHNSPGLEEYARCFEHLEWLAHPERKRDHLEEARQAMQRQDWLLASTELKRLDSAEARKLLAGIEERGKELLAEAEAVPLETEAERAFGLFWKVRTGFHRFPAIATPAQQGLERARKARTRK